MNMWITASVICFITAVIMMVISIYLFYKKRVYELLKNYKRYHRRILKTKKQRLKQEQLKTKEVAFRYMEMKQEAAAQTEILLEKTQLLKEEDHEMETAIIHN